MVLVAYHEQVNFSSGRYFTGGSPKLPFDAGFEVYLKTFSGPDLIGLTSKFNFASIFQGVGLIAAVGESVKNLEVGTPAAVMTFGAYSEFMIV